MQRQNHNLWTAISTQGGPIGLVLLFGFFVNLLVLTGPLFALQVYDRVLSSRSSETLLALVIVMAFLFLIMGVLDHVRKRLAARIGERIVSHIEAPVFTRITAENSPIQMAGMNALGDLENLRVFIGSGMLMALLDLPWFVIFIMGISMFHPALGWLSLGGAALFLAPGLWNLLRNTTVNPAETQPYQQAQRLARIAMSDASHNHGIPLGGDLFEQWQSRLYSARHSTLRAQDERAGMAAVAQTFRLFLQSAIIALGAYLVLLDQLSSGAIIATTVLLSRALGPLDLLSQNAPTLRAQISAIGRLNRLLNTLPPVPTHPTNRPRGNGIIADQITVFPPGARRAALRMVSIEIQPGRVLGLTGPSQSGKTALVRAILGHWPVAGGGIRIGTVPVQQIGRDTLSKMIGYLPQDLQFFDGSIAQNISGFQSDPDSTQITDVARATTAYDMVMTLPDGFETRLGPGAPPLPGGMLQRIGLARALYNRPQILLLDAPGNNLDTEGINALNGLIKTAKGRGSAIVVISQHKSSLQGCDTIMSLDDGTQKFHDITQGTTQGHADATLPQPAISISGATR